MLNRPANLVAVAVYIVPPAISQAIGLISALPEIIQRLLSQIAQWALPIWQWLTAQIGGPPEEYLQELLLKNAGIIQETSQDSPNPRDHSFRD